jgi:short chain dehydrogenase
VHHSHNAVFSVLQAAVKAALSGKDVGVLVNNVGVSYPHPKYFHELTDAELEGLTTLNVTSTVAMTRLALPAMLEKRKGAIVNMASAAAVAPTALLSGYSGAKGYVLKLSESLNVEYAPKGIHVQCQVPLLVATKVRHTLHLKLLYCYVYAGALVHFGSLNYYYLSFSLPTCLLSIALKLLQLHTRAILFALLHVTTVVKDPSCKSDYPKP